MCGIVGFAGPGDQSDILAMMTAVSHRGPDGCGSYADPEEHVFLGHRRLSIIDISGGDQPMWNGDQTIGIVFNGEIYNHFELRSKLEARGHRFKTDHADTEVLIHGYAEWGEALPLRLNGMFAFAIYDRTRRLIFLARDRFGEKPLYFARQGSLFAFASELHAISRHTHFHARQNRRSLQKFLAYGFLPAPNAMLEDCQKLPGGSSLVFDAVSRKIRITPYWSFALEPDQSWLERSEAELAEELRSHLFEAVRRRLISDVPLGFFLSGGIDSSAVLAGAARALSADRLKTFTLGFTEPSFDESEPARVVARTFRADHRIEWLDEDQAREVAPFVLSKLDEPIGDASILPSFLLSRFTRRYVTVALSGDGGDELFAGYDPFCALAPAQIYERVVPRQLHNVLRALALRLPISARNMSIDFKLRRTLAGLSYPPELWNPIWLAPVEPGFMAELFETSCSAEELYSEALDAWDAGSKLSLVERTLEFYTRFYLQDDILAKTDRASMMCGLESRAVFLDNDLVEFCRRLPQSFKLRNGRRKYLLKKALEGILPDDILSRRKKGFGVPTAKWLRSMPKTPPLAPIAGMRMDRVEQAWREHRAGRADHRLFLWSWLSLQSLGGMETMA